MCGIAGFVESPSVPNPFSAEDRGALVGAMCGAIRHRGPDDEGAWSDHGVGIGMRRSTGGSNRQQRCASVTPAARRSGWRRSSG